MSYENALKPSVINRAHWENGLTYEEYRKLIVELLKINQTTGSNHSEKQLGYTRLNVQRMNKWDKIVKIGADLKTAIKGIKAPQKWLILTEAWCGDAAQNIPLIVKAAELNPDIELTLLLRDENLDIMDAYLTNGAKSIPKLIIMDDNYNELAHWGPRPDPAQKMMIDYKADDTMTYDEFSFNLHSRYAKDKGNTLQAELTSLLGVLN